MPELVSLSRPEPRLFRLESSLKTLTINVREREHFARGSILHDGRYQPALVEADVVKVNHLTSRPRLLK